MKNTIVPYGHTQPSIIRRLLNAEPSSISQHMYNRAELDAFRSNLKASLAKQAMNNTASLAIEAERLLHSAPGGKEEYELIMKLYAREAMLDIMESGW